VLDDKVSQRQAVSALQQAKGLVELVVAHEQTSGGPGGASRLLPSGPFLSVPAASSSSSSNGSDHSTGASGLGANSVGGSAGVISHGRAASESLSDMVRHAVGDRHGVSAKTRSKLYSSGPTIYLAVCL